MTASKFRKKPVEIEAMEFTGFAEGETGWDVLHWIDERTEATAVGYGQGDEARLVITTLEGDMTASLGDWIIRGVQGEFYPCKPDIFQATYDAVEP